MSESSSYDKGNTVCTSGITSKSNPYHNEGNTAGISGMIEVERTSIKHPSSNRRDYNHLICSEFLHRYRRPNVDRGVAHQAISSGLGDRDSRRTARRF